MLSEQARQQWIAYGRARASGTAPFRERDELHRFLVGLHLRAETVSAADLGSLLDEAGLVDAAERQDLTERIEWGLGLLDAYTTRVQLEDEAYGDIAQYGGFEI